MAGNFEISVDVASVSWRESSRVGSERCRVGEGVRAGLVAEPCSISTQHAAKTNQSVKGMVLRW